MPKHWIIILPRSWWILWKWCCWLISKTDSALPTAAAAASVPSSAQIWVMKESSTMRLIQRMNEKKIGQKIRLGRKCHLNENGKRKRDNRQQRDFIFVICVYLCAVLWDRGTALFSMLPCLIAIYYYWYTTTTTTTPTHTVTYQIVYVLECWGEIVSRRKYVNRSNSMAVWPGHSWNVYLLSFTVMNVGKRMRMPESVTVPCIFDFRFVSLKLAFPQWFSILWFHFYALFVRFRSGSKFWPWIIYYPFTAEDRSKYAFFSLYPSICFSPALSLFPHRSLCMSVSLFRSRFISRLLWITVFWLAFLAIFKSGIEAKMNNNNKKKCEQEI